MNVHASLLPKYRGASPINAGPQTYVLRAALHALDHWVRTGEELVVPAGSPHRLASAGGVARLVTGFRAIRR